MGITSRRMEGAARHMELPSTITSLSNCSHKYEYMFANNNDVAISKRGFTQGRRVPRWAISCPHECLSLRQCSRLCSYVASGRQRRKALTVSAEKTPCISAIDTTNFARQIVLDFEFAPVPKQRQRRGLRNEIIEVGAVKLDYHGNVMGEFSQFVQTEFTEGVAFPVRELTGISAVDTAMADPLYMVIKRLSDWIGRYSAQVVCWSGADRRQLLTECQAKHIDLSAFPTDWADLQAFYTSIMDVGSHGRVSLGDAAAWFGIEFDESTGHAHSAGRCARNRQVAQAGDGRGLPRESARPGSPPTLGDGRAGPDTPL